MANNIKNTADLRFMLLDVIDGVRHGKIDCNIAKAISSLTSQVLTAAKLDYDVSRSLKDGEENTIESINLLNGASLQDLPKQITELKSEIADDEELTQKQKEKIIEMKKDKKSLGQVMNALLPKSKSQNKAISDVYYNYIG